MAFTLLLFSLDFHILYNLFLNLKIQADLIIHNTIKLIRTVKFIIMYNEIKNSKTLIQELLEQLLKHNKMFMHDVIALSENLADKLIH